MPTSSAAWTHCAVCFSSACRPKVLPPNPTADTFSPDRPNRLYRIVARPSLFANFLTGAEASHPNQRNTRQPQVDRRSCRHRCEGERTSGEELLRQHGVDPARAVHDLRNAKVDGDAGEAICLV